MDQSLRSKTLHSYRQQALNKIVLVDTMPVEDRPIEQYTNIHGGLRSLAAYLRQQGYTAELLFNLDVNVKFKAALTVISENIIKSNPIILGFSPHQPIWRVSTNDLRAIGDIIRTIHRRGVFPYIALGGHYASFNHLAMMRDRPWVDFIIRGEGEESLFELVSALPDLLRLSSIKGLTYRSGNQIIANPLRSNLKDIDQLPFPVLDHLDYLEKHHLPIICCNIATSRGCYGRCTFCSIQSFYRLSPDNFGWRPRSPQKVVDHIALIQRKYGCSDFIFSDDNFMGPGRLGKERAQKIAREIIKRGLKIKFKFFCRTNEVEAQTMKLLKQAGLKAVGLGVESGSDEIIKLYEKGTTTRLNREALLILDSLRITAIPSLIFVNPYSTLDEIKKNIDFYHFLKGLKYAAPPDDFILGNLDVISGAPIKRQLETDGLLEGDYLNGYGYRFKDRRLNNINKMIYIFNPTAHWFSRLIAGWEIRPKSVEQKRWLRSLWRNKKEVCFYYALDCVAKAVKILESKRPQRIKGFLRNIEKKLYRLRYRIAIFDQIWAAFPGKELAHKGNTRYTVPG